MKLCNLPLHAPQYIVICMIVYCVIISLYNSPFPGTAVKRSHNILEAIEIIDTAVVDFLKRLLGIVVYPLSLKCGRPIPAFKCISGFPEQFKLFDLSAR